MLNNSYSVKFSELNTIKELMPGTTMSEVFKLGRRGVVDDIVTCKTVFPTASTEDISAIVNSRHFIRWFMNNKKITAAIMIGVPAFSFGLFKLHPGEFLQKIVAYNKYGGDAIEVYAEGGGNFFSGQGAILLHMLIIGFITLVVCSFLKFTGRGDFIPLVSFVGGAIILKEVIGLFTTIYQSISTMLNM